MRQFLSCSKARREEAEKSQVSAASVVRRLGDTETLMICSTGFIKFIMKRPLTFFHLEKSNVVELIFQYIHCELDVDEPY